MTRLNLLLATYNVYIGMLPHLGPSDERAQSNNTVKSVQTKHTVKTGQRQGIQVQ